MDETAANGDRTSPAGTSTPRPGVKRIDRYVVLGQLGRGGMGEVLRAYDPKLDREVALKVLRTHSRDAAQRQLREAEALAQIAHPNVVSVFDVGATDGEVFIAMELVEGVTLRQWIAKSTRTTTEILAVLGQAGQGLVAAHARGIVHRDFKPANVLVGNDGRVRGPGQSRPHGTADSRTAPTEAEPPEDSDDGLPLSAPLTAVGTVLGTPRYMSPEQHRGDALGPRSDQFSFCVALVEALQGRAPFDGRGRALYRNKDAGRFQVSDLDLDATRTRALLRGMAAEPDERWPSMDALVDALEPASRTWLWGTGLATVAALGAVAWLTPTDERCARAGASLDAVWNDTERERVAAAFERTGRPFSRDLWTTGRKEIDAWAAGWTAATLANCRATYEGGGQSERDYDARLLCLERQMRTLETVLGGLQSVDADSVGRGLDTIEVLPDPAGCTADAELAPRPSDPDRAAALDAGHAAVDACRVLSSVGDVIGALACAHEALTQAQELGDPHLLFDARRVHVGAVADSGKRDEALRLAEALYFDVHAAGRTTLAASTALTIAFQQPATRAGADVARQWLRRADALCETDAGRAKCARTESQIERRAGNEQLSIERAREAVAIEDRRGPSRHLGISLNILGRALTSAGRIEDARQAYERSLQVHQAINGGSHDTVATAHNNLGTMFGQLGQLEASVRSFERALEIRRGTLPHEHRHIATATANIGESHARLGRYDRALPFFVESAEVFEAVEGPQSSEHTIMRVSVATALRKLGRLDEARESLDIALGICRHLPLETDVRFDAETELALLEEASGNPQAAVTFFESALEAPLGKSDRKVAQQQLDRLRRPAPSR